MSDEFKVLVATFVAAALFLAYAVWWAFIGNGWYELMTGNLFGK